eukprot:5954674-Ditylum_brightwellii.AAC.1
MGHPQPLTPLITDNNTAHRLTMGTMTPKCSKAVDMHFHWLKKKGKSNKADYHGKHHHPKIHQQQQIHYIVNTTLVQNIKNVTCCRHKVLTSQVHTQGCAKAFLGLSRAES